MTYTVIFGNGTVQLFYVKAVAELYASLNKGFLVSQSVLDEVTLDSEGLFDQSALQ